MKKLLLVFLSLLGLGVAVVGCPGQDVRGQATGVKAIIENARKNGAYYCAPKELALAEAHWQRTQDELFLGNLIPAKEHIAIADENAKLAFKKSPPEKCAPKVVLPSKKDTDGDGCTDDVDKCPTEPEDKDGFQDDDCCPDPDNDNDGVCDPWVAANGQSEKYASVCHGSDKCPNEPEDKDGFQDEDGCPDPDNDNDGIPDALDKCPNEPEDRDGFQDDDGCPDPDNDNDTVPDLQDQCPNQPGDPANNGCPVQYKLVQVTGTKIELKQKVHFATAKTKILPRSFPLLTEVAKVLKDMPNISVRIEGHTDSRGNDNYNLRLSQGRADSVRTFLLKQGIDGSRMEAVGYGESRPIESNNTRQGREANRRVEFFITKQ
jgi:OOP family OmpA-OmpF porin